MIKCNVAFTGLDATENPYPGLSVIRSIKESPEFKGRISVFTYDSLCTGVYQHSLVDSVYLIPYPFESEDLLFNRIREIHSRARIDVIIPCLDSEIATYARLSQRLRQIGISVFVPSEEAVKARSKIFLKEFCDKHKIDYPQTFLINDPNQIDTYSVTLHYPLLLKGSIIDTAKVNDSREAHIFFNRLANEWGLPLLMQENLDGEEYDVVILADTGSNIIAKVAMKKIGLTAQGKAFAGLTVESAVFDGLAEKVVKALNWRGPLELELMFNRNLNKIYIIEINARFPSWVYTSVATGLNMPLLNLKLALGQKLGRQPAYKKGIMFARIVQDAFCSLNYLAQLNLKGEIDWLRAKAAHKDLLD